MYTSEDKLPIDYLFVSETDEKGIITYANEYFSKICGWPVESLVGQPHSIIRHPDVPKAAFFDLWNTIQKGQWWDGFVKIQLLAQHLLPGLPSLFLRFRDYALITSPSMGRPCFPEKFVSPLSFQ